MPLPIFLGTKPVGWPSPLQDSSIWGIKASAPPLCAHLHTWGPREEALWGYFQPCESLSWGGSCWGSLVLGREAAGTAPPPPGVLDT